MRFLLVLAVALASAASPAFAAFEPAVTISEPDARFAEVALDKDGDAVAVWQRFDGSNFRVQAAFRPKGGSFGAAQTISEPGQNAGLVRVAIDRRGSAIAIWSRFDGSNSRVQTAFRPKAGSFGAAQTISDPGADTFGARIAVDKDGDALAVWQRFDGSNFRVQAAFRPKGGSFGAAQTISDPGGSAQRAELALNEEGEAVAVWERFVGSDLQVEAAFRPARGSFGVAETVSAPGEMTGLFPEVAIDKDGDAVAVWQRSDGSTQRIEAAFRSKGGGFGPAQTISDPGQHALLPQVALDRRGRSVAVWERFDGSNLRIQAAFRPAGGAFGVAQTISAPGRTASSSEVAVDKGGDAVAVWQRSDGLIEGAARPRAGSFGAAQTISNPGLDSAFPEVALDKNGDAVVVWQAFDGSSTRIQAAFRPAR